MAPLRDLAIHTQGNVMDIDSLMQFVQENVLTFVIKIGVAALMWVVGRWVINLIVGAVTGRLERRKLDKTLVQYAHTILRVLLLVVLVAGILGYVGLETATLAGLLAGAGVGIGMAWSGMLQNFAAGVFLVVRRPFHVGDEVTIHDYTGTIVDIGLFMTTIKTWDHVHTFVGNSEVLNGTIRNYNRNNIRRVESSAQMPYGTDFRTVSDTFKKGLLAIPGVLEEPEPMVKLIDITPEGPVVAVRPCAKPEDFWDVWYQTQELIEDVRKEFAQPGQPISLVSDARADAPKRSRA